MALQLWHNCNLFLSLALAIYPDLSRQCRPAPWVLTFWAIGPVITIYPGKEVEGHDCMWDVCAYSTFDVCTFITRHVTAALKPCGDTLKFLEAKVTGKGQHASYVELYGFLCLGHFYLKTRLSSMWCVQGGQRGETSCSEVAQEEMEPNFSKVVTPALNKGEIRFTFAFIYIYILSKHFKVRVTTKCSLFFLSILFPGLELLCTWKAWLHYISKSFHFLDLLLSETLNLNYISSASAWSLIFPSSPQTSNKW